MNAPKTMRLTALGALAASGLARIPKKWPMTIPRINRSPHASQGKRVYSVS